MPVIILSYDSLNEYGGFPPGLPNGSADKAKMAARELATAPCVAFSLTPGNIRPRVNLTRSNDFIRRFNGMQNMVEYRSEVKTVPFNGKTMTIENLTPVLTPKERERRKKEIEQRLFDVFSKYRTRTASSRF